MTEAAAPTSAPVEATSAPAEPTGAQQPPEPRTEAAKRRAKINGREVEIPSGDIPPWLVEHMGEDGAIDAWRIKQASMQKMQEAASLRKQLEAAAADLKHPERLEALIRRVHGDEAADQWIEDRYAERVRRAQMTPEERQQRERETALERREREIKERESKIEQERAARATAAAREQYTRDIASAITEAKLPKSPQVTKMIAGRLMDAIEAGETLSPSQAAADVRDELRAIASGLWGEAEADEIEQLLGEGAIKKLRARDVERLKAKQPRVSTGQYAPPTQTRAAPSSPQRKTVAEMFEERERMRDGKRR